jgi:hypothetical protein
MKVHIKLGDHDIDNDADAIKYLDGMPFGVSTIEGLEKIAADADACAHLPHVKLGVEQPSGNGGRGEGEPDLGTEKGREEAVRTRVALLRKTYEADELEAVLQRRRQTIQDFARQELATEHPKAFRQTA